MFLAQAIDGTPLDIAFGAIDFELHCVARASAFDFGGGISLLTCCAEDLIVMKVFANRDREAARVYGRVRKKGTPIGSLDMMIGAHALVLGVTLATNNTREFSRSKGLTVVDWLDSRR